LKSSYNYLIKKRVPDSGDSVISFYHLYTKIPLIFLKIKKEVKIRGDIILCKVHLVALSGYKCNGIFKITRKKGRNV